MSVVQAIVTTAGVVTGLGVIGGAVAYAWRKLRPLIRMAEDWSGEPERRGPGGVLITPARLSVMERLAALEEYAREWQPNGGKSLRDKIDRLLERLEA